MLYVCVYVYKDLLNRNNEIYFQEIDFKHTLKHLLKAFSDFDFVLQKF